MVRIICRAVAHAALPLALAAVTTILGLLSLCYSDLHPIYLFGVFSAIGVAVGGAAQFLLLPAALTVWMPLPARLRKSAASGVSAGRNAALDDESAVRDPSGPPEDTSRLTIWPKLGELVTARPGILAALCLGTTLAVAAGLPRIRTSIQMMRLFRSDAPVIPMTRWLEEHLGATIPLEVVLAWCTRRSSRTSATTAAGIPVSPSAWASSASPC